MRISDWSSDVCSSDLRGERAATFCFDPEQARFGFDIMTGGESGKLRTAPVQEATVDQLAACACGVDGGADLRIADLPQSNAPGFLVQCCDGKDRLPLAKSEEHTSEL